MTKTLGTNNSQSTTRLTGTRVTGITLGIVAAGSLAACGAIDIVFDVEGSGTSETISYEFDSFDRVDIGSSFEADIEIQAGDPTIEITMDDNLFEHLEVEVSNGELEIQMDDGSYDFGVDPKVTITMPSITALDVSGATDTELTGLDEAEFELDSSGAASIKIDGSADVLIIDSSGATSLEMEGTATEIVLDSSGAANVDLDDVSAETVTVDASGASSVELGDVAAVSGEISGASSLEVPDGATVSVSTSGTANVRRR